jgi:fibronectin type 3 domain-containing protein
MKSRCGFSSLKQLFVFGILAVLFAISNHLKAQAPPVPATFQDLYTELDNYLVSFNATLGPGNGTPYPTLMSGSLKSANGNIGPQLLNGTNVMQYQLNALKAMGVQAITVQCGFPLLYEPFLVSQGQSYSAFVTYYQSVAQAVRAAGLKLIVENDTLLTNDVQAGWDVAPFYATLDWNSYQLARVQTAVTVAQTMLPDYIVVLQEPTTEFNNSGQSDLITTSGSSAMLSQIVASLQQAAIPGLKIGAGTGTSQQNALSYIQQYVTLPIDFIDIHIYPINFNLLPIALQMASTAAGAGKSVSMTECWMWKARDTELNVLSMDLIRSRDTFSFWAPLDAYFLQTMQNLANNTQMLFLDPFGAEYYFAYLPYDTSTQNLSPSAILAEEGAAVSTANMSAQYTTTGLSYYHSIVTPADTTAPATPGGLTGVSDNPTTTSVNWLPATDNVGVAGYNLFRSAANIPQAQIATVGTLYYQDSGLTEATTYTYNVQSFDLAGNVSPLSAPFNVQTSDITPPTTPGNVTVTAVACTRATMTWSPSTDNTGITEYLLFMGMSQGSLMQVAIAGGTATSYSNSTLSPATTYYFAVQAEDKNHNISYMSAIVAVTTPALPLAPANVLAKPTSTTKVAVTWSAPTGGLTIAHYIVYRGSSISAMSQIVTVLATSYNDLSVAPATKYYYSVQAADTGTPPAQSGLSAPVAVTTYSPPAAPANLVATPISCTKVSLTWSASVSGGLPIANYRVFKGSSATGLTQLAITTNISYTDITDAAQTTYYYAVQAADTGAPPALSPMSNTVKVTTFAYPSVPANLVGVALSSSKVSLTWSASISGGLPITNYKVYQGITRTSLSQVATTINPAYTNVSLAPATLYYYAVQAVDSGMDNSAQSPPVPVITTQLPTVPTNVVALGTSSTQISVTWTASTGGLPIAYYFVFRGSSSTNMSQVATTKNPLYNDRNLPNGTTYYYGIQADDTGQDLSAISNGVAGSTLP